MRLTQTELEASCWTCPDGCTCLTSVVKCKHGHTRPGSTAQGIPAAKTVSIEVSSLPTTRRTEADLQARCERWLQSKGFYPRTQKCLDNISQSLLGWYVHLAQCEGNPLLLDLLILHRDGRYLEVELKTEKGRVSKHQSALVEHSPVTARLVRSYDAFVSEVQDWIDALWF